MRLLERHVYNAADESTEGGKRPSKWWMAFLVSLRNAYYETEQRKRCSKREEEPVRRCGRSLRSDDERSDGLLSPAAVSSSSLATHSSWRRYSNAY